MQVGPKLKKARDRFRTRQCGEVQDQERSSCSHFNAGKIGIGYYFIGPGKQPHVECAVMKDDDILEVARKYFGVSTGR